MKNEKRGYPYHRGSRGVTLVETAIFLPVVLLAIFIVIGVAVMLNARRSLSSALVESVRLANTRGNVALVGQSLIQPVSNYVSGGSFNSIASYISSPTLQSAEAEGFLNGCFGSVYGRPLSQLPTQYIYTLIYMNKALQESIGGTLRFPCRVQGGTNPGGSCQAAPPPTPGCVACYLLNPTTLDLTPVLTPPDPNVIALRCEYTPASLFMRSITGLLSLIGAGGGVSPFVVSDQIRVEVARDGL
jgi:hypothetical protein